MAHGCTVGIVTVSFNTRGLLEQCLRSLASCTLPLRIVVVDNASHDGSAALVREHFPGVILIEPGCNLGFAAGTNLGVRFLLNDPPDYLLLLNPDTIVQPGAIETLVAFAEAHQRVGVVGPRLLNPDGSVQAAAFRFPTLSMTVLDLFPPGEVLPGRLYNSWWHGRYPQEGKSDKPFPIDHPLGACMLVRPAAIATAGLLDEGFFMYVEEVEWCRRIRAAGWAIWQEPRAQVVHVGGAATRQFRARMLVALYRSRLRYFRMTETPRGYLAQRAVILIGLARLAAIGWWRYARKKADAAEVRARTWALAEVARDAD